MRFGTRVGHARGRRRPRGAAAGLAVLPLAVVQLVLVCFYLHLFSPAGETCPHAQRTDIRLVTTVNGLELLVAPLVQVSAAELSVDSIQTDARGVGDRLETMKHLHPLLHPDRAFEGRVLVSADRDLPWSRLREVLAEAEVHGYPIVDFVVVKNPPLP